MYINEILQTSLSHIQKVNKLPENDNHGSIVLYNERLMIYISFGLNKWVEITNINEQNKAPINPYNVVTDIEFEKISIDLISGDKHIHLDSFEFQYRNNEIYLKIDNNDACISNPLYIYDYTDDILKIKLDLKNISYDSCNSTLSIKLDEQFIYLDSDDTEHLSCDIEVLGTLIVRTELDVNQTKNDVKYKSVFHEGNDGKGSELNAARLDGIPINAFSTFDHHHSEYVDVSHNTSMYAHPDLRNSLSSAKKLIEDPTIVLVKIFSNDDINEKSSCNNDPRDRFNKFEATEISSTQLLFDEYKSVWEIAEDQNFDRVLFTEESTNNILLFDKHIMMGTYYVRMRYVVENVFSAWSSSIEFKVDDSNIELVTIKEINSSRSQTYIALNTIKFKNIYDKILHIRWLLYGHLGNFITSAETQDEFWTTPELEEMSNYKIVVTVFGHKSYSRDFVFHFSTGTFGMELLKVIPTDYQKTDILALKDDGSELIYKKFGEINLMKLDNVTFDSIIIDPTIQSPNLECEKINNNNIISTTYTSNVDKIYLNVDLITVEPFAFTGAYGDINYSLEDGISSVSDPYQYADNTQPIVAADDSGYFACITGDKLLLWDAYYLDNSPYRNNIPITTRKFIMQTINGDSKQVKIIVPSSAVYNVNDINEANSKNVMKYTIVVDDNIFNSYILKSDYFGTLRLGDILKTNSECFKIKSIEQIIGRSGNPEQIFVIPEESLQTPPIEVYVATKNVRTEPIDTHEISPISDEIAFYKFDGDMTDEHDMYSINTNPNIMYFAMTANTGKTCNDIKTDNPTFNYIYCLTKPNQTTYYNPATSVKLTFDNNRFDIFIKHFMLSGDRMDTNVKFYDVNDNYLGKIYYAKWSDTFSKADYTHIYFYDVNDRKILTIPAYQLSGTSYGNCALTGTFDFSDSGKIKLFYNDSFLSTHVTKTDLVWNVNHPFMDATKVLFEILKSTATYSSYGPDIKIAPGQTLFNKTRNI